jgi:hypothetical protein
LYGEVGGARNAGVLAHPHNPLPASFNPPEVSSRRTNNTASVMLPPTGPKADGSKLSMGPPHRRW